MPSWDDVTTFEQLQAMTPQERSDHFRASVVLDPAAMPQADRDRLDQMTAKLNERTRQLEDRLRGRAS